MNELLNQVVRAEVGEATARIREYYMARAFFSTTRKPPLMTFWPNWMTKSGRGTFGDRCTMGGFRWLKVIFDDLYDSEAVEAAATYGHLVDISVERDGEQITVT